MGPSNIESYTAVWAKLLTYTFHGFLAYTLTVSFLIAGLWFGGRRGNFILAGFCFAAAALVMFGAGFIQLFS